MRKQPLNSLWPEFRRGNKEAFSHIYKQCYPKLYTYGINIGMGDNQVRDIIQDVFFKLYSKPDLIKDELTLLPFLFRAFRNQSMNVLKRENKLIGIDDYIGSFTFEYSIEEAFIEKEEKENLKNEIKKLLSCLTPRQKEIIYFRFLYEMDYEEIAIVLNISQQATRNAIYKAFEKIRKNNPDYLYYFLLLFSLKYLNMLNSL